MDDAFLVRRLERLGYLPCDPQRLLDREGTTLQPFGQRLAADELHDEELHGGQSG